MPIILVLDDDADVLNSLTGDQGRLIVRPDHDEKIIGFLDSIIENDQDKDITAGTFDLDGTLVPAGEVWKITGYSIRYIGTPPTKMFARAMSGTDQLVFTQIIPPTSNVWYYEQIEAYLVEGEYMNVRSTGSTLNDELYLSYIGHKMKAS